MYIFKVSPLLLFIGLPTSSTLVANQSHESITVNVTGVNANNYVIPHTDPPVTLTVYQLSPHKKTPIDAPSVYMCAINNLAQICRYHPRAADFANPKVFRYGAATIRMERLEPRREPYFNYNNVCALLRGLPEFMTLNEWWVESFVHVFVGGTEVGTAQVWNPYGAGGDAAVDLVEAPAELTAGAVAAT